MSLKNKNSANSLFKRFTSALPTIVPLEDNTKRLHNPKNKCFTEINISISNMTTQNSKALVYN